MLGLVPGAKPEQGGSAPGLGEIGPSPWVVKCMGRRYSAARSGGAVVIQDVTDITRPFPVGLAEPDSESLWTVRTPRGLLAGRTGGTLHAIAALREASLPPAVPSPGTEQA
ncbi:hypothetical protein OHS33_01330 [Streptomyces sp. NBC_00536]|uniref:hypothetical protein n=1 Tax=Streptomyces sp. NBC_00536 TaxID=2975769 RepID=UPI002E80DC93|nr:hypothetical protein [Streptomyces sp. NBC_00536]WUC77106.1 hypothetical protein OHS33_01330 [Streptomyces sp. NBC_00536]